MNKAIAILFSIALVLGQALAAPSVSCAPEAAACCGCGGAMKCCVSDTGQTNPTTPAPLPSQSSQNDFQFLQLNRVTVFLYNQATDNRIVPGCDVSCRSSDVPIFTRDCAFLI